MTAYTNVSGVPLSIAVYLAHDTYDHDPNSISATSLLKPIRQTILADRVPSSQRAVDVLSLVKSKAGTAIHDAIERAWLHGRDKALKLLGYPPEVVERILVNPEPDQIKEDSICVYMEKRSHRIVDGVKVSGKFDFVAEGRLEDFKNTSVFTYIKDTKDEDYKLQGSLYRWLNPDIITEGCMAIQFIFSDWMPGKAMVDPTYPKRSTEERLIPLMSIDDTEKWVSNRIQTLKQLWDEPQENLPECTEDELWRKEPVFKYYKNPEKRARSTKNFDTREEANQRKAEDGDVGVVVEIPGQVIACKYCAAFPICTQAQALIKDGSLIL